MPKLGFGLMRLPEKDGKIDSERVGKMVDDYMASGLNYFDTAYVYHGGTSENVVRDVILKRYKRDSFTVATKLPAWSLKTKEDRDKIFNEQLSRAGVDYFDFYLLHSLEDGYNYDTYERLDCFNWALEKKAQGKIVHFGFSFHGTPELLEQVLDKHPEVEFVQIQLNYLDWDNPVVASGRLYEILTKRNIPIIVMEPVKGGTLAKLRPDLEQMYKSVRSDKSIASWALRFVASLPGVMTILSGMSDEEQMRDNLSTFKNFEPLSDEEQQTVRKVTSAILDTPMIGCTACRYCTDGCPMNIKIPDIFKVINTVKVYNEGWRADNFYKSITQDSGKAGDCIACGQCEGVCPQHLPIIDLLKEGSALLDKKE
ncbi:MAG: aldo/keto reductase [Ruminococcus sp.]|nr:aldo/keto reductase [Ruminococcus sp.]